MALPKLTLDERDAEFFVSEAKRRIPNYTREWTDFNESDPGMALVQLFGWLSEMIVFRLNQVPDQTYLKFLELLGITLNPATPARADLAFTLTTEDPPTSDHFVEIPQGTRVSLSDAVEGGPVIFETTEALFAVGPKLTDLQSFDTARYVLIDESKRGAGKKFAPFGDGDPRSGSALYLGFSGALPRSQQRSVTLAFYLVSDALASGQTALSIPAPTGKAEDEAAPATEADDAPPVTDLPPALVEWEYFSTEGRWTRLEKVKDGTANFTKSGKVSFQVPGPMLSQVLGQLRANPDSKPRYWIRAHLRELVGGGYQRPPMLEDVALSVVEATNALTVTDELLGASDGAANQRFQLAQRPVIPGSLNLLVYEIGEKKFMPWTRVNDFSRSARADRHYLLNALTGEITFGDGVHGRIPPRQPGNDDLTRERDTPNIRAASYRWGGGSRGNAGAGKITSLESAVPYVEKVTNIRQAEGGANLETIEEAKRRAPAQIRTRSRAVTGADYEALACETPGAQIKRARALPLHHPLFEPSRPAGNETEPTTVRIPGVVTVVVVPDAGPAIPNPTPSEATLARVGRYLNRHRLITTELFVAAPKYRQVSVEVTVNVKRSAVLRLVEDDLQKNLRAYFHPLTGGSRKEGWEFGGQIVFSETFSQILKTEGVDSVVSQSMRTWVDDVPHDSCTDIALAPDEIVYSREHLLTLKYAEA